MSNNLSFTNSRFTIISHFTIFVYGRSNFWEMLNVKLMINDKCKMLYAAEGGLL
jgi:hypothetical protein